MIVVISLSNILYINSFFSNISSRLFVIIFPIGMFLLFAPLRNAAVRRQRRIEDDFGVIYLPFWIKLILFPMFCFSKKPFKDRTVKYRLVNLLFLLVAITSFLIYPNLAYHEWLIYILIFCQFLLLAIFKQYSRGGPYF